MTSTTKVQILKFTDVLKLKSTPRIQGAYIIDFGSKKYVGSSKNILQRLTVHRTKLRNGKHQYSKKVDGFKEKDVFFKIFPTNNELELEMIITRSYKEFGLCLNEQIGRIQSKEKLDKIGEANSKLILNTQTGIYHTSAKELCETIGIKRTTLKAMLNGQNKNRTPYIYV